LNYIIGNPPFVGHQWRSVEQKADMAAVFPKAGKFGKLDFVAAWFYKAAIFCKDTQVDMAFVSTNSITMGDQVAVLWEPILEMGYQLSFAHRTFQWHNDAKGKASVHCVIIGFGQKEQEKKYLFDYLNIKGEANKLVARNINPYLIDAPSIVIKNRSKVLSNVGKMIRGNQPTDGGFLLLSLDEKQELLGNNSELEQWIKPILGAREFLNNGERYCLWLVDASVRELKELMKIPEIKRRIEGVKDMRLNSTDKGTQEKANTPWLFRESNVPETYILVPRVSSERRDYVPMGFFDKNTVSSDANLMIPNASIYEFGILTSQIHMDWMRTVAGRLKSDYRYSAKLVYNNFPWPSVSDTQRQQIEAMAQAILDARQAEVDKDANTSLADLYDPDLMPPTLRKAHKKLDKAVDKLYQAKGFDSPLQRVKHLFELYEQATT